MSAARAEPALGIIGAGRLGTAIAQRWRAATGRTATVWSRRLDHAAPAVETGYAVGSLASVMRADVVLAALPTSALATLAAAHPAVRQFRGSLLLAGVDRPLAAARELAGEALAVRALPALLPARDDVPSLVLRAAGEEARWERSAKRVLEALGPVFLVDDERALEALMYFVSPFPVVARRAFADALAAWLDGHGVAPRWRGLAGELLWQALAGLAPPGTEDRAVAEVATPGGLTAAGLGQVHQVTAAMRELLAIMAHARGADR